MHSNQTLKLNYLNIRGLQLKVPIEQWFLIFFDRLPSNKRLFFAVTFNKVQIQIILPKMIVYPQRENYPSSGTTVLVYFIALNNAQLD